MTSAKYSTEIAQKAEKFLKVCEKENKLACSRIRVG